MANFFDQFDEPAKPASAGKNFFDQFDSSADPAPNSPQAIAEQLDPMLQESRRYGFEVDPNAAPVAVVTPGGDPRNMPIYTNKTGVDRGFKDPYVGVAQMGVNAVADPEKAANFNAQIDMDEQRYQNARAYAGRTGLDVPRLIGNIGGTAPAIAATMALPEMSLGAGALYAAGEGAALSATQPVTDSKQPFWGQKGTQAGVGALTGGLVRGGAGLVGRAINPTVDPAVSYLRQWGVTPTIGQNLGAGAATLEDVTKSFNPGVSYGQRRAVNQFNVAAYNHVLAPIGETFDGQPGREAVRVVGDRLSSAYDELVPNLQLVPDQQLATDLSNATAERALMSEAKARQFDAILEQQIPRGPLSGQSLKDIQNKLTKHIQRFERSGDPDDQMIADGLSDVRTALMDNLARTNPDYAERLAGIDRGWANLVRLERASGNTSDGVFTPAQLLSAARATDTSVRRRAIARGMGGDMQQLADAGVAVLGNKYPDSGTALRSLGVTGALVGGAGAINLPAAASYLSLVGLASLPYAPAAQRGLGALVNGNRGAYAPIMDRSLQILGAPGAAGASLLGGSLAGQ